MNIAKKKMNNISKWTWIYNIAPLIAIIIATVAIFIIAITVDIRGYILLFLLVAIAIMLYLIFRIILNNLTMGRFLRALRHYSKLTKNQKKHNRYSPCKTILLIHDDYECEHLSIAGETDFGKFDIINDKPVGREFYWAGEHLSVFIALIYAIMIVVYPFYNNLSIILAKHFSGDYAVFVCESDLVKCFLKSEV